MFELTEKGRAELRRILDCYPDSRAALLPVLWLVQDELGYISDESIEYVSSMLDLPRADVYGVVTFYTMFNRKMPGRYHIQLCRNICCWLRGAEQLFRYLEAKLGITVGETTEDGLFMLSTVECLGACGGAPMMQINKDYYENLTSERVDEILEGLRNGSDTDTKL